jgi:exonuclease III
MWRWHTFCRPIGTLQPDCWVGRCDADRDLQRQRHQRAAANLRRWLQEAAPDIVCLQELKAPDDKFPAAAIRAAGYGAVWHGQKSWNGVAIVARGAEPEETRRGLQGDPDDMHSRYIEAAIGGLIRLQAALVRTADGLRQKPLGQRRAGRSRRRLQRHADRSRRLRAGALGR